MNAPLPGDITRQLRELADTLYQNDHYNYASDLLDLANAVERLEGNFLDLASITAASADDLAEMKTIATFRLDRHHGILETVAKALDGIPAWRHPSKADQVRDRVVRVTDILAKRLKKVPR